MDTNDTTHDTTHDTAHDSADDSAPQAPPPAQLLRFPDAGPGAGVAAGLGSYFGLDPVLFRIGFVLLSFAGGTGILLYLVGWALIPEAPAGALPPADGRAPASGQDATRWLGIALVVVAGLWLSAQLDIVSGSVLWAVALIVVGLLLFRGDLPGFGSAAPAAGDGTHPTGEPAGRPAPTMSSAAEPAAGVRSSLAAPPDPPPARAPSGWAPTGGPPAGSPPGQPPGATTQRLAPPPPPPPHPAPTSYLGRLTTGLALVVGGGAALLDNAGVLDLGFRHYVALALLVVGAGLLMGAWWGRARGLIAVGLLLVPLVLFAGVADAFSNARGGVGDRFYTPASVGEVADSYELFAGRLSLDLSDVDFTGQSVDVRASVTFGELFVVVPPDTEVEIDAVVGGGEILLPADARNGGFASDRPVSGLRVDRRATLDGDDGRLDLELSSGFGTITVRRAP